MRPFIYSILFFLSITLTQAQREELVLKERFKVDESTILNLDVDNVTILFKESSDDTIKIEYSILFKKNSEEVVYRVFKDINAKVTKHKNVINLEVKNSMYLGELHNLDIDLSSFKELLLGYVKSVKEKKLAYRSKDSILKEIQVSLGTDTQDYIERLKKKNPTKKYGKGSKKFEQKFIIYVPKNLKIKLKSLRSRITFNCNIHKPIKVNAYNTYFKLKKVLNKKSEFDLDMGIFQAENIVGGKFNFKDVDKVVIGTISNAKITTEISKVQIGEIGKGVKFIDFNSKLYFYDFDKNFNLFELSGDYSKLHFFDKKNTVTLSAFGNTTTVNFDGQKISFEPRKENKKYKMLEKKIKNKDNYFGHIDLNITHGIIEIKSREKEH